MAKTYRVGIIGSTGRGDYGHAVDTAFLRVPRAQIVAVADDDPAGRAAAQQRTHAPTSYADYRQMFAREQLDLVAICPRWIDQHYDMLLAAADAACHVYMEKPFCRTLAECDEVVRAFEMRHLQLNLAHTAQFSPVLDEVKKTLQAGTIGDILEFRARGKEDQRGGGEDLWVLGSHLLALMRTLAESDPIRCYATFQHDGRLAVPEHQFPGAEGIGPLVGDHVQGLFTFPNGTPGYFASRRNVAGSPSRFAIQVLGSKGVIEMETGYLRPAHMLVDSSWSPGRSGKTWQTITSAGIDQPEPITDSTYEAGHVAGIVDLIASIEQHRDTKCSAKDGRAIIEMITATFESHCQAKSVDMPLTSRDHPLKRWSAASIQ